MFQQKLFSLGGFHMKSARFHEIHWISYGFHEIQWISCEIHPEPYKFRCFSKNSSVWVDFTWNLLDFMKSTGFHTDFMKSSRFHMDFMKSGGFHTDFMKSGGFHVKSKDLLQGIVTLCFRLFSFEYPRLCVESRWMTNTKNTLQRYVNNR